MRPLCTIHIRGFIALAPSYFFYPKGVLDDIYYYFISLSLLCQLSRASVRRPLIILAFRWFKILNAVGLRYMSGALH